MLQIFLLAFEAVLVVGPTDPESWAAAQGTERVRIAACEAVFFMAADCDGIIQIWNVA